MLNVTLLAAVALGQVSPPIVEGETTTGFEASGALVLSNGHHASFFCSATLIHPEWVITAAHCVEAAMGGHNATVVFVLGHDIYRPSGVDWSVEVDGLFPHPEFDARALQHDIGLMRLSEPIDDVQWVPLSEERVGNRWLGTDLTYVGFGVTSDEAEDSGVKRTVDLPFYEFDDHFIYTYDPGGGNLCQGDSGGGGFREQDGEYLLAGVSSFVFGMQSSETSCVGGGAGAARVDTHLDWIWEYVDFEALEELEELEEEDTASFPVEDTGLGAKQGDPIFTEEITPVGCGCSSSNRSVRPFVGWWLGVLGLVRLRAGRRTSF